MFNGTASPHLTFNSSHWLTFHFRDSKHILAFSGGEFNFSSLIPAILMGGQKYSGVVEIDKYEEYVYMAVGQRFE